MEHPVLDINLTWS